MGYDDPVFTTTDAVLAETAVAPLGADRVAELKSRGWLRLDGPDDVLPYADGGFETGSGKVEFFSAEQEAEGLDPLPAYRPAREGPQGDATVLNHYPLILLTAKGAHHFLNSGYVHVERAVRAEREPLLDIHPVDAELRGVVDRHSVRVFNDRGSLTLHARVSDRVRPGVVSVPSGWWASAFPVRSLRQLPDSRRAIRPRRGWRLPRHAGRGHRGPISVLNPRGGDDARGGWPTGRSMNGSASGPARPAASAAERLR